MAQRRALIIGAGPAGLTAAFELLKRSDVVPIVLEKSEYLGGISRTVRYKGNRMDIGGHRFFSKSDRVMNWWIEVMPVEASANGKHDIGMIAEEVGKVVPEVVSYDENGKDARGIDYARLTAVLVEAVKQQEREIQQQQRQIGQQKAEIRTLQARMQRLETPNARAAQPVAKPAKIALAPAGK